MKALATAALLVLVTGCGQGKAIFNVDVYSFMAGTGKDTIPYAIPPGGSASASTFQKFQLPPGFGSSVVDSVRITTGSANLINTGGSGALGFSIYFAADSAGTLSAPSALDVPPTSVSGTNTVPVTISGDLSSAINAVFTKDTVWIRISATGTNSGVTPVTGRGALTALVVRVVVQDKIL
ncbi:MAG TPA: hypothetical protein VG454_15245 [Gemmatimonadales bacterium]|nr:hypothetical protein [Gemmatimonadales bacterium]